VAIDWGGQQPAATRTFKSVTPVAKTITIIFALNILWEVLSDVNGAITIEVMGRVAAAASFKESELTGIDQRNTALAVLSVLVALTGVVFFCIFMVRANKNARSFGTPMSIRPGWAAGYFFVPLLSLWKPYQAMKEIWQGSDPDPNVHAFNVRVSPLVGWWWGMYLAHNVCGRIVWQVNKHLAGPQDFINAAWTEIATSFVTISAALLAIAVVRAVARRQDERQSRHAPAVT
jgi:hypothetical protein